LLDGGGAEGIGGGQADLPPFGLEPVGQLRHRRGLAAPVDAGDHDHGGLVRRKVHGPVARGPVLLQILLQHGDHVVARVDPLGVEGLLDVLADRRN